MRTLVAMLMMSFVAWVNAYQHHAVFAEIFAFVVMCLYGTLIHKIFLMRFQSRST